nr:MAG: hypothetical protein [Wufeng shrew martellivirus 2]
MVGRRDRRVVTRERVEAADTVLYTVDTSRVSDIGALPLSPPAASDPPVRQVLAILPRVMTYTPWGMRETLLTGSRFVLMNDFVRWLREFQFASFFVKANRDRVRESYAAMRSDAPFRRDQRFPAEVFYIRLAHPAIRVWVDQALHAVDLPDRLLERSQNVDVSSMNDAKRSYDVSMDRLARLCEALDVNELSENGVFCRETFEKSFGLTWTE